MPFIAPLPFDTSLPRPGRTTGALPGTESRTTTRSAHRAATGVSRRAAGPRRPRPIGVAA